jgi:hypothetical protein
VKEKTSSDRHYQCQKETDEHLLAYQQFSTESHIVARLANERASFLNMNNISSLERLTAIIVLKRKRECYHYHHQPINVPTAGVQAFLMDYT